MYDPNADRRKEFQLLMQNSIAPLPETPQFAPMQPMELAPLPPEEKEDEGMGQMAGLLASLINKKKGAGLGEIAGEGGI